MITKRRQKKEINSVQDLHDMARENERRREERERLRRKDIWR